MVAVTTNALAARVGLEALQQGGSAADAAWPPRSRRLR